MERTKNDVLQALEANRVARRAALREGEPIEGLTKEHEELSAELLTRPLTHESK